MEAVIGARSLFMRPCPKSHRAFDALNDDGKLPPWTPEPLDEPATRYTLDEWAIACFGVQGVVEAGLRELAFFGYRPLITRDEAVALERAHEE